jgi:hypothetical protein
MTGWVFIHLLVEHILHESSLPLVLQQPCSMGCLDFYQNSIGDNLPQGKTSLRR